MATNKVIVQPVETPSVRLGIPKMPGLRISAASATSNRVGALQPTVVVNGNVVTFNLVTLQQMEKMTILPLEDGFVKFTLTRDSREFYLHFSDDSIGAIAGELVLDDSIDLVDAVFDSIEVILPAGSQVIGVYLENIDANLLKQDVTWRMADLQRNFASYEKSTDLGLQNINTRLSSLQSRANQIYNEGAKQDTLAAVALQEQQGFDTVLSLLREQDNNANTYAHDFSVGLYDEFYTISGKLSTSYSKEVKGVVITQSLKVESNTQIAFTSEADGVLRIYAYNSKTTPFSILVDDEPVQFDSDGIAEVQLEAGMHTITKDTANTFVFYVELEMEAGSYASKLDKILDATNSQSQALSELFDEIKEIKQLIINEGILKADEYSAIIAEINGDWDNE